MKNLKNFIFALTLVFILSGVTFADGQMDMPKGPLPSPTPTVPSSAIVLADESSGNKTLIGVMMTLIRDFISIL